MLFVFTILTQVLIEIHFCSSPFSNLGIILFVDDRKDVLSKQRNAEIRIGAERLSKDLLSFLSFVFK